ncbi:hypothetical protein FQN55_009527 [Onygenales sp. PD_40]|nr:hypothetical protein FQN55_009527 [Onygenales sp. PD_40]
MVGVEGDSFRSPALEPPIPYKNTTEFTYRPSIPSTQASRSIPARRTTKERRKGVILQSNASTFTEVALEPESYIAPKTAKIARKTPPKLVLIEPRRAKSAPQDRSTKPLPLTEPSSNLKSRHEQSRLLPETSPYRSRISRLHFGPFYLGAPVFPGTTPKIPPLPEPEIEDESTKEQPDNSSDTRLLGNSEDVSHRFSTYQARSTPFLRNLGHRRSRHRSLARRLTFRERCRTRSGDDEISEDEVALTDISTLDGGSIDFGRLSRVDSESLSEHGDNEFEDSGSQGETDVALPHKSPGFNSKIIGGREVVIGPPAAPENDSTLDNEFRAKAIREIGQQWAEKEKAIVTVREAAPLVDLSSLGAAKRHQSLANIECLLAKSSTFDTQAQSYFYPPDPEQPNWKPFSIRRPFITLLIVLSLLLAGIQEWLCQRSEKLAKEADGLIRFNDAVEVSLAYFFCWKYLPTMIFVAYGVLWQITDYETKRLEPYYQLSQPAGSIASKSLNLDYLSAWIFLVPVKSLRYRHWAVFCSSVGSLFATLIAPSLQNPSIIFLQNPLCQNACPTGEFRYFVRVQPAWSRLLTTSLLVVAISGIFLFIQLRRKSGLLSDPKGIAGIASMATKSHILTDFQGMDEAQQSEIHKRLKHHYILYKSTIWHGEYVKQSKPDPHAERAIENPHPLILQLRAGIAFLIFLLLCLISIPIINFTPVNIVAVNLPWLPVLVATLVKQFWTTLEFAVRTIEPFYVLSNGNASPQMTLTLDYRGTPYGLLPIQALQNRHYIVALAGVGSVLGDILTVTVSSFSVNGNDLIRNNKKNQLQNTSIEDQTFTSFTASLALSLTILLFLIISATLIYIRRRHPFLPRQPSTIASVLGFIYQSRMLDDFVDTEQLDNRQMEARLAAGGKRYGLGWFRGRDGKPHCAVDEEPMLSRYVHGVSYIRATAPWEEI